MIKRIFIGIYATMFCFVALGYCEEKEATPSGFNLTGKQAVIAAIAVDEMKKKNVNPLKSDIMVSNSTNPDYANKFIIIVYEHGIDISDQRGGGFEIIIDENLRVIDSYFSK